MRIVNVGIYVGTLIYKNKKIPDFIGFEDNLRFLSEHQQVISDYVMHHYPNKLCGGVQFA